jgi:ABC-type Mn2+/Zn2+ transport system permease subunit
VLRFDPLSDNRPLIRLKDVSLAYGVTLVGVVLFWIPVAERRVSRESLIGYAYASAMALAVVLAAKNPSGELQDLDLLSGNVLFVDRANLGVILAVTAPVSLLHLALRKDLLFVFGSLVIPASVVAYALLFLAATVVRRLTGAA